MQAQSIFIRPNVGYGKTSLYNKEDLPKSNFVLPMVASYAPNASIAIGKMVKHTKAGISEIYTGIGYANIQQKYMGTFNVLGVNAKESDYPASALVNLHYVTIPIGVQFAFIKPSKLNPFLQLGLQNNILASYSDVYKATYNSRILYYGFENKTYVRLMDLWQSDSTIGTINKDIYKRYVLAPFINVGGNWAINENIKLLLSYNFMYGINDAENKTDIEYKGKRGSLELPTVTYNKYNSNFAKISRRDNVSKRGDSHITSNSFNLSFQYFFQKQSAK
jgi:hypothetical protein